MPKIFAKGLLVVCVIFLAGGCSSATNTAKQIEIRSYVQDKARIDQEITGKVGNWENSPMAVETQKKPTRKMYYLEVSKEVDPFAEPDGSTTAKSYTTSSSSSSEEMDMGTSSTMETTETTRKKIVLPSFDDEQTTMPTATGSVSTTKGKPVLSPTEFSEYKVEKDDTLQKISKKFYNTFSLWTQIYEVNKDRISNPNFIKPGTVIRIPAMK